MSKLTFSNQDVRTEARRCSQTNLRAGHSEYAVEVEGKIYDIATLVRQIAGADPADVDVQESIGHFQSLGFNVWRRVVETASETS